MVVIVNSLFSFIVMFSKNIVSVEECLQRQIDAGCDVIGAKLKRMYREGGDAICGKDDNSSALNVMSSVVSNLAISLVLLGLLF
mgnify:CR=1 FL=1